MTLGGLALAIGILVDEATVEIENIHTQLDARPTDRPGRRGQGNEDGGAAPAGDAVRPGGVRSVVLHGGRGQGPVRAAVAGGGLFAMVASYLLSSTFVPVISTWLISAPAHTGSGTREHEPLLLCPISDRLQERASGKSWVSAGWWWALTSWSQDRSSFWWVGSSARKSSPSGCGPASTPIARPDRDARDRHGGHRIAGLGHHQEEAGAENVAITLGFVGVHAPSYPINLIYLWNGGSEEGVLQVQLKPGAPVRIEDLKERLRRKFAVQLPEVSFSFEPSDIVSRVMSLGASTPIEVAVSGPNLAANRDFAEKVKTRLQQISSLRDVQFGQALDYPTVDVTVNRERAGPDGGQDVGSVALARGGDVVEPVRRPELLGGPEQRRGVPDSGADSRKPR